MTSFLDCIGLSVFWKPDSGRIPHKPLSFIVLDLLSRYLSSEVLKSILSRNFFIFYFTSKFLLILSNKNFLLKLVFPFFFSSRFLWGLTMMFNFAQCVLPISNKFRDIKKLPTIVLLGSYLVFWLLQNYQAKSNRPENIASWKNTFGR